MRVNNYKGFELDAHREKCLAGYDTTYLYAERIEDGWFLVDTFEDSEDSMEIQIESLKNTVDDYLKNPESYDEPEIIDPYEYM
jgi:hypothetical protein